MARSGLILMAILVLIAIFSTRAALPVTAVEPGQAWPAVASSSLAVVPGSALDLSPSFPQLPLVEADRLQIDGEHFRTVGGAAPRLLCATLALGPSVGGYPKADDADRYALELRRRGYNLARFVFVDAALMTGRKLDFDFDPIQLDRLFYLLAALKKQGVYWMIDGLTSPNGAMGDVQPHRWVRKYRLDLEVFWSDAAGAHWRTLVKDLWGRRNPYTGLSTLADPALMGVILVNENNLRFLQHSEAPHPELAKRFGIWIRAHAEQDDGLRRRWSLNESGLPDSALFQSEFHQAGSGSAGKDMDAFLTELELDAFKRLSQSIRDMGYAGPVTMFNVWNGRQANATRSGLPWVDMHNYHDLPTQYTDPGSRILNTSSLIGAMPMLTEFTGGRVRGKPFTASEYGQPFWNSYRHEAGLTIPLAAAAMGWAAICRFAENSVNLDYGARTPRERLMTPFMIGLDPIARAGELTAALLYRRGDGVAPTAWPRPLARALGMQLDLAEGRYSVVSARTEAAVIEAGEAVQLPTLSVQRTTARAAVVLADIGIGPVLRDSRRLLLVVSTDALNTGMKFADVQRMQLLDAGKLPVRIEPTQIAVSLRLANARLLQVHALDLTGRRIAAVLTTISPQGALEFSTDTGKFAEGPAMYFEIAVPGQP